MIAEERLENIHHGSGKVLSEAKIMRTIHELEVRQIELELQNEKLLSATEAAENADRNAYTSKNRPGVLQLFL